MASALKDARSQNSLARQQFERRFKRFYHQLTVGCSHECDNKLCVSSGSCPVLTKDAVPSLNPGRYPRHPAHQTPAAHVPQHPAGALRIPRRRVLAHAVRNSCTDTPPLQSEFSQGCKYIAILLLSTAFGLSVAHLVAIYISRPLTECEQELEHTGSKYHL